MGNSHPKASSIRSMAQKGQEKKFFSEDRQAARQPSMLNEGSFQDMLTLERRRAERSRKPFVLMLLSSDVLNGSTGKALFEASQALIPAIRETDLIGWYQMGDVLGIIFTEVGSDVLAVNVKALRDKMIAALQEGLGERKAANLTVSVHMFPENWGKPEHNEAADAKLYPDIEERVPARKRISQRVKRALDIVVSAVLLFLLLPLLGLISILIKLTSKGPVLFAQKRLGQFGAPFHCLKFRTMYLDCDSKIHKEFIEQFIAGIGKTDSVEKVPAAPVYKITNDPRVTPVGRFLRKTSLDELPQFWNVLRSDMSLVGPRPPLPYEFKIYDIWHRRRVVELKPGITGLWQVSGRSRTRFDDMVRLDLRYAQTWSLWLDIKILLATPWAVFSGSGAY